MKRLTTFLAAYFVSGLSALPASAIEEIAPTHTLNSLERALIQANSESSWDGSVDCIRNARDTLIRSRRHGSNLPFKDIDDVVSLLIPRGATAKVIGQSLSRNWRSIAARQGRFGAKGWHPVNVGAYQRAHGGQMWPNGIAFSGGTEYGHVSIHVSARTPRNLELDQYSTRALGSSSSTLANALENRLPSSDSHSTSPALFRRVQRNLIFQWCHDAWGCPSAKYLLDRGPASAAAQSTASIAPAVPNPPAPIPPTASTGRAIRGETPTRPISNRVTSSDDSQALRSLGLPAQELPGYNGHVLAAVAEIERAFSNDTSEYSLTGASFRNMRDSVSLAGSELRFDLGMTNPSYCTTATYLAFMVALQKIQEREGYPIAAEALKKILPKGEPDGVGFWGVWNDDAPGSARYFRKFSLGTSFTDIARAKPGDFLNLDWEAGGGHSVVFLGYDRGTRTVKYWSSNKRGGYGIAEAPASRIGDMVFARLETPKNLNLLVEPARRP